MRLWHVDLLPYLPDLQFKGQLRELVAIMRDWRDKGKTNHLLINKVMKFPKNELVMYYRQYEHIYRERYGKNPNIKYRREMRAFGEATIGDMYKNSWHNKEYLRVCMANLYEKHYFGVGKSRITDEEWEKLLEGYKALAGENYVI